MADATLVELATKIYIYGYPLLYNLDEIAKMPAGTATLADGSAGAVQHVLPGAHAARPDDEVRLAEQRHAVPDRAAGPQRRTGRAPRPRHRRPLLRAPVRRRVDEQLRLHRPARDRHRRG